MFGVVKIKFDPTTIDPCFVKVLALLFWIGGTQTSTGKCATFKGGVVVVAPGPPKFGLNTVPIDVSNAGSTDGALSAVPIFWVGGGFVEVVELVAVGWFCKAVVLAQT